MFFFFKKFIVIKSKVVVYDVIFVSKGFNVKVILSDKSFIMEEVDNKKMLRRFI